MYLCLNSPIIQQYNHKAHILSHLALPKKVLQIDPESQRIWPSVHVLPKNPEILGKKFRFFCIVS